MWCAQCETDVVGEMSADGQSLSCAHCGSTLQQVFSPSLHPETRKARELLERWSRHGLSSAAGQADVDGMESARRIAPLEPTVPADIQPETYGRETAAEEQRIRSPETRPSTKQLLHSSETAEPVDESHEASRAWRVDAAHEETPKPRTTHDRSRGGRSMEPSGRTAAQRRSDKSHADLPHPHFDVAVPPKKSEPGQSEAVWGQVLAYSGVGVLTIGTVLVLWGYFGGIESYASTGWLVSTAGQMLLLLGIVTLVSGGMQQTTHEVGQRIEYLNGRMFRIERSTKKLLRGPHFGKSARRSTSRPADRDADGALSDE